MDCALLAESGVDRYGPRDDDDHPMKSSRIQVCQVFRSWIKENRCINHILIAKAIHGDYSDHETEQDGMR